MTTDLILVALGVVAGVAIGAATVAVLAGRWVVRTIEEIASRR